ncbi:hypothetical protein [Paenibacillus chibensis]|uniref:hypothetical protein n=1 Tax=Paenibacillus chibensis TaxID=59846 RepID=UPI000FD99761|nr:hypothetical protein [Paenibacillus chibensis]MEC0370204.1 hypothetical protein [Paenibacillus chibensis]
MKTYLIISQIIYLLFIIPWLFIWGISFMAFDSGVSAGAILLVTIIGVYPLVAIASSIMAWVFHKRKARAAAILNLMPLLWVLGIGGPVFYINVF